MSARTILASRKKKSTFLFIFVKKNIHFPCWVIFYKKHVVWYSRKKNEDEIVWTGRRGLEMNEQLKRRKLIELSFFK